MSTSAMSRRFDTDIAIRVGRRLRAEEVVGTCNQLVARRGKPPDTLVLNCRLDGEAYAAADRSCSASALRRTLPVVAAS